MRHIGVWNFDVEQPRRAQAIAPAQTLQPPYSLVDRAVEEEILPFAERAGIGVIAHSPMGSGLLSDTADTSRRPGRPRSERARHAILGAAADLLLFQRAVARGEAPADLDVELALDLIYGPVYHRLLHGHAALTDRFATAVVDLALTGILSPRATPDRAGGGQ